jgi:hypothetical protein
MNWEYVITRKICSPLDQEFRLPVHGSCEQVISEPLYFARVDTYANNRCGGRWNYYEIASAMHMQTNES